MANISILRIQTQLILVLDMLKQLHGEFSLDACDCLGVENGQKVQDSSISLPLKNVTYNIHIIDGLANVQTTQTYKNSTDKFLEVQYRYPINPRACLYRFHAKFGNRLLEGIVKERTLAQQQFKQAVKKGHRAGFGAVSKQSKDIMIVQIGNIGPGEQVRIEIAYVEELSLTLNVFYKFDLPAKLRPRYLNSLPEQDYFNSFRKNYQTVTGEFYWDFRLKLSSSKQVIKYDSFNHKLRVEQINHLKEHIMTLEEGNTLLKDFSFIYTTQNFQIPSYVLGKSDNSSTALVSFIPKFCHLNVEDARVAAIKGQQLDVDMDSVKGEYIFLLDRSGSMDGCRIQAAKRALILFIKSLPVDTYFNIISFGSNYQKLFQQSVRNEKGKVDLAIKAIAKFDAELGGTQIQSPLRAILKGKNIEGYPRQVFLLTDGAVYNTTKTINLVRENIKYSRVHTIGIGDGASEALIKGCAQKGKGYHIFIKDHENSSEKIIQLLNDSLTPVLTSVRLDYDKDIVESIVPNPKSLPYILKGDVANFYVTFKGQICNPTFLSLKYTDSLNNLQFVGEALIDPTKRESFPFVDKMGHFRQILALEESQANSDKVQNHLYFVKEVDKKKEIINLSTKYQILSKYTAFSCVQMELLDGVYQQLKDKGQERINISSSKQYYGRYNVLQDSEEESDEYQFQDQCCIQMGQNQQAQPTPSYDLPPPQLQMKCDEYQSPTVIKPSLKYAFQQIAQKQMMKKKDQVIKNQDNQVCWSIEKIINQQHVQGYWSNPAIIYSLMGHETLKESVPLNEKNIVVTLLIVRWLQLHHSSKQYALIIKKAKAWLNKQKDIAQIKANYGYLAT